MSSDIVVYLVTGANRPRGLGFSLVGHILRTHENAFVYAAVRDPAKAVALHELKEKYFDRLAIVECVSADVKSNSTMAKEIEERHGRVDTVIANAALLGAAASVHEVAVKDMEEHFRVNVVGPMVLFGAVYKLLKRSTNPRFIPISSPGGSLSGPIIEFPIGSVIYASTKATLNWIARKIHFENEWIIAFPLSPGEIDTDMFDFTVSVDNGGEYQNLIKTRGYGLPPATEVAASLLKIIDNSTREENGGAFMNVDGGTLPW
ncbi:putative secondary metabolism biosynthetic enzyme [Psilocybe cubensis]|nr:putative secondary metabolism biosynthetic enzyme [Psilocybe cubensis]KAH9478547.1 putative secondary metabolism biosynthetic enzyme [Psilocybe cubensis]